MLSKRAFVLRDIVNSSERENNIFQFVFVLSSDDLATPALKGNVNVTVKTLSPIVPCILETTAHYHT